jgi:hypothetical protein
VTRYNQIVMRAIGTVVLGVATVLCPTVAHAQTGPPPVGGRLAGAVLLGEPPLTVDGLPSDLSSADRMRLLAYLERWTAFKTRQGHIAGNVETWKRRERLEREIASVIERDGIEQVAYAVAWSQGPYGLKAAIDPGAEAAWAEGIVREPSNAVAAPYLYAFLASRYRLQFEQAPPDDRPALERLAKKYRTMIDRVRNSEDGLFRILADDLDNRSALTAGVTRHPRQYLPDT